MKRLISMVAGIAALVLVLGTSSSALAALCFNCGSGSSGGCKQCRSRSGKDTFKDRKFCKSIGCRITGTSSCSTAANVKVCAVRVDRPRQTASARATRPVPQCSRYLRLY
ncbi:MAG: hypothetical protein KC503_29890 [Myxococcales bacterium]|nr:hypothetical protein [Myxococcales bacterium]